MRAELCAWRDRAEDLAAWADQYLVNRRDAWGQYRPLADRATGAAAIRRGQLTHEDLARHFCGESEADIIGLLTTAPGNTCRWGAIDIDAHGVVDRNVVAQNRQAAMALRQRLERLGLPSLLLSSNGRGGYHIWTIFAEPVASSQVYGLLRWLLATSGDEVLAKAETFPRQARLNIRTPLGNFLRLPGRHHTRRYVTRIWGGNRWLAGADAVQALLNHTLANPDHIPAGSRPFALPQLVVRRPAASPNTGRRPIDLVLARLHGVSPSGSGWSACCPAHYDANPSLSVSEGADGRVLLYCHAGCSFDKVVDALEMDSSQMFARPGRSRPVRIRRFVRRPQP